MDTTQDPKQHFSSSSFRELHKIQRQVLQASPSYVTDQSIPLETSVSHSKVIQSGSLNGNHGRQSFSAGSQARGKSQVFLPGDLFSPCNFCVDKVISFVKLTVRVAVTYHAVGNNGKCKQTLL